MTQAGRAKRSTHVDHGPGPLPEFAHIVAGYRGGVKESVAVYFAFSDARDEMDSLENRGLDIHYRSVPIPATHPDRKFKPETTAIDEPLGVFSAIVSAGVILSTLAVVALLF